MWKDLQVVSYNGVWPLGARSRAPTSGHSDFRMLWLDFIQLMGQGYCESATKERKKEVCFAWSFCICKEGELSRILRMHRTFNMW